MTHVPFAVFSSLLTTRAAEEFAHTRNIFAHASRDAARIGPSRVAPVLL
jgi:hypothetical protein